MGFDGSSITGFNAIEESDMIAMPDATTFAVLPWRPAESGVARMFCDVVTPERQPYEGDPRFVLRRALERAEAMGFDRYNVGPELEYFYFRDSKGTEVLDEGGYFDSPSRRRSDCARDRAGLERWEYTWSNPHEGRPSHTRSHSLADALSCRRRMTYRSRSRSTP